MKKNVVLIKKFYFGHFGKCYTNICVVESEDLAIQYELENPMGAEWHYEFEVLPFGLPALGGSYEH